MIFDDNATDKFDVRIELRDGVVYANKCILEWVFRFFENGKGVFDYPEINLKNVEYPSEVTRDSFRYCLAFAYSPVQLPEVQEVRNGPSPDRISLEKTLDYFNASEALIQAVNWHIKPKPETVPTFDQMIDKKDIDGIKWLLKGMSPPQDVVITASRLGDTDIVKLLLGRATNEHVMHADCDGNTALIFASIKGYTEIVKLLLGRVTNEHVMHANRYGHTALILAISQAHGERHEDGCEIWEVVNLLLGRVTDEHVMHASNIGNTALILASQNGYRNIVELLLEHVTDEHVMHANNNGNTALILASQNGYRNTVELLEKRINSNKRHRVN